MAHNELRAHGKAVAVYRLSFVSHVAKWFGEEKEIINTEAAVFWRGSMLRSEFAEQGGQIGITLSIR